MRGEAVRKGGGGRSAPQRTRRRDQQPRAEGHDGVSVTASSAGPQRTALPACNPAPPTQCKYLFIFIFLKEGAVATLQPGGAGSRRASSTAGHRKAPQGGISIIELHFENWEEEKKKQASGGARDTLGASSRNERLSRLTFGEITGLASSAARPSAARGGADWIWFQRHRAKHREQRRVAPRCQNGGMHQIGLCQESVQVSPPPVPRYLRSHNFSFGRGPLFLKMEVYKTGCDQRPPAPRGALPQHRGLPRLAPSPSPPPPVPLPRRAGKRLCTINLSSLSDR